MYELIVDAGNIITKNMLQFILGCIMSIPVYFISYKMVNAMKSKPITDIIIIIMAWLIGIILPVGMYGMIPLMAALFYIGFRFYAILPLALSNSIFNVLLPFNDPTFTWTMGYRRIILSFIIAIFAGLILRNLKINTCKLFRYKNLEAMGEKPASVLTFLVNMGRSGAIIGMYLIMGTLCYMIFNRYILWSILSFLSTNQSTSFIPRMFAGYNVGNWVFLQAISIGYVLMDFVTISAMLTFLKIKGIIVYFCYLAAWIFLLGVIAFI